MLAALLLIRLPQAAHLLYEMKAGTASEALRAATDQAADLLLDQLGKDGVWRAYRHQRPDGGWRGRRPDRGVVE